MSALPQHEAVENSNAAGEWLRHVSGSGRYQPASGAALVGEATDMLGAEPVRWAVDLGHQMANRIIAEIPRLGGGSEAFETLRMGTESATLVSMLLLVTNDPARIGVTQEALEGDRDFVRRGIPLDQVLRGIRLGHSLMAHGFLEAAAELIPEPHRAAEMKRTSDLLFEYIDDFASSMSAEYLAERDRWVTSAAAARAETVRVILDGKSAPGPEALARLGYPLDHYHLGLVLWHDAADGQGQPDLQHAATKMLDERGASAILMVPHGASALWVWAAWRSGSEAPSGFRDHRPAGSRVAIGTTARGLEGFRRTHREAEQLADLARTASGGAGAVLHFADFELAVLLAQNADLAANFIRSHLGPAADDNPTAADLRETVLAYLSHERSLNRAAEALHVARNTVAYRVKKFENLIGRDLKEDRLNIEAALTLADFFGHSVIPEP